MSSVDPNRPDVKAFMTEASLALDNNHPDPDHQPLPAPKDVFRFGGPDNPRATDERLALALDGQKTAATSWPVPRPSPHWGVGDVSVILDGQGRPAAVMRTLSLVECRFADVAVDFALAEAEGSYEDYRRGHFSFYAGQENGHEFSDESMVLCERFEVIYPFKKEEEKKKCQGEGNF